MTRTRFTALLTALVLIACTPFAVLAQTSIVAVVNGQVITSYDVDQRMKLLKLTDQAGGSRERALDELIDESVQVRAFERSGINVSDADVDGAIGEIATRVKLSPAKLADVLARSGIQMNTLRDRMKAQIGFNRLVRARFQSSGEVTEQDLVAALLKDDSLEKIVDATEYELEEITIALPEDPSPARLGEAERRAADLRSRFSSCSSGVEMARKTKNVVVRPFGRRMETDLRQDARDALEGINVGQLSKPFRTSRGLTMFAVCDKKTVQSANAAMKALEPDLTAERGDAFAKQYLRQLRRDAVIERR